MSRPNLLKLADIYDAVTSGVNFKVDSLNLAEILGIKTLFIELFSDTEDIDTSKGDGASAISSFYKSDTHIFDKNTTGKLVMYSKVKTATSGNSQAWAYLDWTNINNGSATLAISRDNGVTFTEVAHNNLVSIDDQASGVNMVARLTLTGKLKFNNVAWGVK